jgi:hypothetical protein
VERMSLPDMAALWEAVAAACHCCAGVIVHTCCVSKPLCVWFEEVESSRGSCEYAAQLPNAEGHRPQACDSFLP